MAKRLLLLAMAPIMGAAFALFLPAIGFILVGKLLWDSLPVGHRGQRLTKS